MTLNWWPFGRRGRFKKGHRPWNKDIIGNETQAALILKTLCEGEWVGGREACIATKSHNGLRRLNELKRRLQRHDICYWVHRRASKAGRLYKVIQIIPSDRERARKLIRGA